MKVNYLEKQVSLTGSLTQDSLSVVAERLKGLLTRDQLHEERMSYWQLILLQSKANGCFYHGKDLPHNIWEWPKNTWFQKRTHHLKDLEFAAHQVRN
ncbi:MAG: hypothetical protein ACREQA_24795 [Candidatus Binatia bacterium]